MYQQFLYAPKALVEFKLFSISLSQLPEDAEAKGDDIAAAVPAQ